MSSSPRDDELHRKAVDLIREAYHVADGMRRVNLDALNEPRPPTLRYHAQYELVMEFIHRANTMLDFAGHLGLIGPEEDGDIRRSFANDHPELIQWLEDEDKRLSADAGWR